MKKNISLDRLHEIVKRDLKDIEQSAIVPDGSDYIVFGNYRISPKKPGFVVCKHEEFIAEFSTLRSAMSWCSADRYQKKSLGDRILTLEKSRAVELADLSVRSALAKHTKSVISKDAIDSKLQSRRYRLAQIEQELDKCIDLAKYWQIQGFNNETARTGRSAPHRTSRSNPRPALG
jgi:hypothetical protein